MTQQKFIGLSATELVDVLAAGQASLLEVFTELNAHKDQVEPLVNAFDSRVLSPELAAEGPLHGLPITVKDQIAVAGHPRNFGLDKEAVEMCAETASIVQKFIDAGATIVGKTSMPPYALDFQTFNGRAGRTNNPWNLDLTPGGSSGGGAAAAASGMSYLDIGTDLSGSLRLPAAYCGICSLLPGEGAVETDGLMLGGKKLGHFARPGPLTRCVDDLILAWSIMSGSQRAEGSFDTPRLGFWDTDAGDIPVDASIASAFAATADLLLSTEFELGSTDFASLFDPDTYRVFGDIMGFETSALIPAPARYLMRMFGGDQARRSPQFLRHIHSGYRRNVSAYQAAIERKGQIQHVFDQETRGFDALLMPVCGVQPFQHRSPDSQRNGVRDYKEPFQVGGVHVGYLDGLTAFTVPISLMGNPVVTLPLGPDDKGRPVGAQLVGKRGGEWQLLEIAKRIETALPQSRSPFLV